MGSCHINDMLLYDLPALGQIGKDELQKCILATDLRNEFPRKCQHISDIYIFPRLGDIHFQIPEIPRTSCCLSV